MRLLPLLLLLVVLKSAYAISINEINPRGAEFVEISNLAGETINLEGFLIKDSSTNLPDNITCHNIPNCSLQTSAKYFLILGRSTAITDVTNETVIYYYTDDSKIGSGLNDAGDTITFFSSDFSTSFSYGSSTAGKSWQRYPDESENWQQCIPTPGKENFCAAETVPPPQPPPSPLPPQQPQTEINNGSTETLKEEVKKSADFTVTILDFPLEIGQGEKFTVKLELSNFFDTKKSVTVYSYVFKGQNLVTEGGWAGNSKLLEIESGSSVETELQNIVKDTAETGLYSLRVRAVVDERKYDDSKSISIVKGETLQDQAPEEAKENEEQKDFVTGAVVWQSQSSVNIALLLFAVVLVILNIALLLTVHKIIKSHK